jgi:hypothetical protein
MKISTLKKELEILRNDLERSRNSVTGEILKTKRIMILERDIKTLEKKISNREGLLSSLRFECPFCKVRWNPTAEEKESAEAKYDLYLMHNGQEPHKMDNPWFPVCEGTICRIKEKKMKDAWKSGELLIKD